MPLLLRHAIPALGNVWQLVLKTSALVSVTGVAELMTQSQTGAGSTGKPFDFFMAAVSVYFDRFWLDYAPRRVSLFSGGETLMDFPFLYDTFLEMIPGIPLTLQLAVSSVFLGFFLALGLALMQQSSFAGTAPARQTCEENCRGRGADDRNRSQ
ncbi:hypothetical protein O1Q74_18125 [Pectobacterium sp. A5351]|nr:hypothetical protein O1Q74_18125 [Pectobacterium sp. A5351]